MTRLENRRGATADQPRTPSNIHAVLSQNTVKRWLWGLTKVLELQDFLQVSENGGPAGPRAWEISGYMSLLWFHWGYAETKLSCRMRSSFICMIHPAWLFPAHIIFSKTQEPKRGGKMRRMPNSRAVPPEPPALTATSPQHPDNRTMWYLPRFFWLFSLFLISSTENKH